MDGWQMLGRLVTSVGLMEILLGKEVTTHDGTCVGVADDIEFDLTLDKIWVIVKREGKWSAIPGEQIAGLADKAILLESWVSAS